MPRPKKIKEIKEVAMTEEVTPSAELSNEVESMLQELDLARKELAKTKMEIEESKKQLQFTPARPIDAQEQAIVDKQIQGFDSSQTLSQKIADQKAFDSVMITGKFMNRRAPGAPVSLPYIKYASDPVKWWPFEDGKTYTIPRGFVNQINGGTEDDPCYYSPKFTQTGEAMDPDNPESVIHSVDTSHKKYAFIPLNF